jgi:hypothetical protein
MGRKSKPKYMKLEKLFKLKIKRFPGLYRGEHKRMKAIHSLLTTSCSEWDENGNLISTDPGIYCTDQKFEKDQKWSWERRKEEILSDIEKDKKEIAEETDEKMSELLKKILKRKQDKFDKYFTTFDPYQDEFEGLYNSPITRKEEIKDWLNPNDTGYGVLEHIPDNAQDESLEIIKEYIEFIFDNFENVGEEMKAIAKNVNARYFRDKKITQLLEE